MKLRITIALLLLIANSCSQEYELHPWKKYAFTEGTILTYESDSGVKQFVVQKIVDGRYEDSRSGTCAKPPLSTYYYQAVYLRCLDSLETNYNFIGTRSDDCGGYPRLLKQKLVSSLNGAYNSYEHNKIMWMDEFESKISAFSKQYEKLKIRSRSFTNVLRFDVPNGKRVSALYYTTEQGFVGYVLADGTTFELKEP